MSYFTFDMQTLLLSFKPVLAINLNSCVTDATRTHARQLLHPCTITPLRYSKYTQMHITNDIVLFFT